MTLLADMQDRHVEAVSGLLRTSFEDRLHQYLPYCSTRVAEHLRAKLRDPGLDAAPPVRRVALDDAGAVVGFAEWRRQSTDELLLTYVCVASSARGRGVASALLEDGLRRDPGAKRLVLDVFAHNKPVCSWYARLGMKEQARSSWWTTPLPRPAEHGDLQLLEVEAALAALDRVGFCRVVACWRGREAHLGLVSERVLRLSDAEQLADAELLAALAACFPGTARTLLVLPGVEPPVDRAERVLVSVRMAADVRRLPAVLS